MTAPASKLAPGIMQVRNRDAGRIGTVCLKYDRVSGRYYDVDTTPGKQICPIRPLWDTAPGAGSQDARPGAETEASGAEQPTNGMEQFDSFTPIGGEELREYNNQGGMA